jgi:hypothetical protein
MHFSGVKQDFITFLQLKGKIAFSLPLSDIKFNDSGWHNIF